MNVVYINSIRRTEDADPDDFYATDPMAALALLTVEPQLKDIWEPACGMGHLSKVFEMKGKLARASDLRDRGCTGAEVLDFFSYNLPCYGDIATNPPYRIANEFVRHAIDLVQPGRFVCMFLQLSFLESQKRYELIFKHYPPCRIHVFSKRVTTVRRGDFESFSRRGMKSYAWFVWQKGYKGSPEIKWITEDIYD